jgi:hypothetical protein
VSPPSPRANERRKQILWRRPSHPSPLLDRRRKFHHLHALGAGEALPPVPIDERYPLSKLVVEMFAVLPVLRMVTYRVASALGAMDMASQGPVQAPSAPIEHSYAPLEIHVRGEEWLVDRALSTSEKTNNTKPAQIFCLTGTGHVTTSEGQPVRNGSDLSRVAPRL